MITNVTLEDNNAVYSCSSTSATITSSVVLNVTGNNRYNICTCENMYIATYIHSYVSTNFIYLHIANYASIYICS